MNPICAPIRPIITFVNTTVVAINIMGSLGAQFMFCKKYEKLIANMALATPSSAKDVGNIIII